jgi:ADP-ribosylglycohydrolase
MQLPHLPAAPDPAARRAGFLVGAAVGAALTASFAGGGVALAPPPGRRRAATALADGLLAELIAGGVDLRRLAGRWLDWQQEDGLDADRNLTAALDHLREFNAPITALPSASMAPLAAVLPAALASASPKAMIAGSFHVARMLDPSESTALAATAIVLVAAAFLEGRRDFVPDVVAALRANDASDELLDAMRAIPRDPRAEPPLPRGERPDPVVAAVWVLWIAHHRPRGAAVLRDVSLVGGLTSTVGAVLGSLLGARDGLEDWPLAWLDGAGEEVGRRRTLARQLGAPAA